MKHTHTHTRGRKHTHTHGARRRRAGGRVCSHRRSARGPTGPSPPDRPWRRPRPACKGREARITQLSHHLVETHYISTAPFHGLSAAFPAPFPLRFLSVALPTALSNCPPTERLGLIASSSNTHAHRESLRVHSRKTGCRGRRRRRRERAESEGGVCDDRRDVRPDDGKRPGVLP